MRISETYLVQVRTKEDNKITVNRHVHTRKCIVLQVTVKNAAFLLHHFTV